MNPKPREGKVVQHLHIREDIDRRVRHKAVDLGWTLSACAEAALTEWLDRHEQENPQ